MDTIDTTEQALLERLESRRQQLNEAEEGLREAEAGLELYRRDREIERQVALDHELALTLQETENQEQRLRNNDDDDDDDDDDDEDSLSEPDDGITGQRTCVTCLDDLSDHDAHRGPCGHDWCQTCIVNRFEMAAKSTHLFPAQCCDEPILPDNHELIAPETWARYFEKKTQVETPNPTFCSKRDCSKFIPLQDINEGQARCICGQITCTGCKAEWHTGECVVDPETEQVLRLAREQQWQRCFHCREMVVRQDGCNEIECRNCHSKFCYACGKEWKTCPCPQFGRAEPADQPPADQPPASPLRVFATPTRTRAESLRALTRLAATAQEVLETVDPVEVDNTDVPVEETLSLRRWVPTHLRPRGPVESVESVEPVGPKGLTGRASPTNSGCQAHSWRRIRGGGTCQSCNTVMPNFLFQCSACHHTSCLRCR
ncbi:hypothetical protein FJTKL_14248 [Diaporthe vaccinii]|uniref:RBR-type E3 ubiquitin transferase n=1 Tax=Diaporthe vaccinii TaxID=105482 RepID=A0ABR4E8C0_9PEZI